MITKEKKVKHIDELHFDHQLWYSEASFFADELKYTKIVWKKLLQKTLNLK